MLKKLLLLSALSLAAFACSPDEVADKASAAADKAAAAADKAKDSAKHAASKASDAAKAAANDAAKAAGDAANAAGDAAGKAVGAAAAVGAEVTKLADSAAVTKDNLESVVAALEKQLDADIAAEE